MLIAVNYHYVRPTYDAPYPGIHGITPEQLEHQCRELGRLGDFVTADELARAITEGTQLPDPAFVITFDDGLREQFDHALPVLDALSVPSILFINTGPIADGTVSMVHKTHILRSLTEPSEFSRRFRALAEDAGIELPALPSREVAQDQYPYDDAETAQLKWLLNFGLDRRNRDVVMAAFFRERYSEEEEKRMSQALYVDPSTLSEVQDRHHIGSHAHEHLPLGLLPESESEALVDEAANHLANWLGVRPRAFSYPYGSEAASPAWVGEAAARAGSVFAFTTKRLPNHDLSSPMHLCRHNCNDVPGGKSCSLSGEAWIEKMRALR